MSACSWWTALSLALSCATCRGGDAQPDAAATPRSPSTEVGSADCLPFVVPCGNCPSGCARPDRLDMGGGGEVRRGERMVHVKRGRACDVLGECSDAWLEAPLGKAVTNCYGICDREGAIMPHCTTRAGSCATVPETAVDLASRWLVALARRSVRPLQDTTSFPFVSRSRAHRCDGSFDSSGFVTAFVECMHRDSGLIESISPELAKVREQSQTIARESLPEALRSPLPGPIDREVLVRTSLVREGNSQDVVLVIQPRHGDGRFGYVTRIVQ